MTILLTGGAGFIGSNFALDWFADEHTANEQIVNIDVLSYASDLRNLSALKKNPKHHFIEGDINDSQLLQGIMAELRPRAILHLAAESHVDKSIESPDPFLDSNIQGTYNLLEATRTYWADLPDEEKLGFRFLHVSTDEVFGSLGPRDDAFNEDSSYLPSSPYSASKAASDHLVRAWGRTYGLPTLITNCSNNYGPRQFPEKLIPLTIVNALAGNMLPIYGDGKHIRDWIYVSDHCSALRRVLKTGQVGESYVIGSRCEKSNLEVVTAICQHLDDKVPDRRGSYKRLMQFVSDRPGHDRRYALNPTKVETELDWRPRETFDSGIEKTISWFISQSRGFSTGDSELTI